MAVDCTDPAIRKLYDAVRDDNDPTNWGLFGYVPGKQKLQLVAQGTGGYQEVLTKFADDQVMYAFVRYFWAERNRTKFIFITWVGPAVKALQKARIGHHKSTVADSFKGFHVELHAEHVSDLEEKELLGKLARAGGADYDGGGRTTGAEFSSYKTKAQSTFDSPSATTTAAPAKATPPAAAEPVQAKTVNSQPGDSADPAPVHKQHSESEPVQAAPEEPVSHPADEPAPEHHQHTEEEPVKPAAEEESEWN